MLSISSTADWRNSHPGAVIGLLELTGVNNTFTSPRLDEAKRKTVETLRERYAGFTRQEFMALPVIAAYDRYYKQFNKTYHVQLQLESIVLKGKNLPSVSPLVDANFMAEIETLILTAGHDADRLSLPIYMDSSREGESMTQMNGMLKEIRSGDMIMRDSNGICCSIIYGQDDHSPISPLTSHVLYVAYAPTGVPAELVETQLSKIVANIGLFSPSVVVEQLGLITA